MREVTKSLNLKEKLNQTGWALNKGIYKKENLELSAASLEFDQTRLRSRAEAEEHQGMVQIPRKNQILFKVFAWSSILM